MKIKELEREELRERIFKHLSYQLWEEAKEEFYISYKYKEWKRKNIFIRFIRALSNDNFLMEKKKIQMRLLEDEVNDALEVDHE